MRFVLFIFSLSLSAQSLLERLNPHGDSSFDLYTTDFQIYSECLVCHEGSQVGRVRTIERSEEKCFFCHNHSPHSGIQEHRGKDLKKLKMNLQGEIHCLSCHRAHNALLRGEQARESSLQGFSPLVPEKESWDPMSVLKMRAKRPMLKRNCQDCHTRENLK